MRHGGVQTGPVCAVSWNVESSLATLPVVHIRGHVVVPEQWAKFSRVSGL